MILTELFLDVEVDVSWLLWYHADTCQTLLMLWVGVSRGPRDASFRELVHRLIICWLSLLIHDEEDEFIRVSDFLLSYFFCIY